MACSSHSRIGGCCHKRSCLSAYLYRDLCKPPAQDRGVEFLLPPASAIAGASGVALEPMIVKLKQVDKEKVRIIAAMVELDVLE